MKKQLSVLCVALALVALVVLLASCDSKKADASSSQDAQTSSSASDNQTSTADSTDESEDSSDDESQNAVGTTYDVGEFSVYVPAGWAAIPQNSLDEPGKQSTNEIELCKGAEYDEASGEWLAAGKPFVLISYLAGDQIDRVPASPSLYDSTEDLADMQIGNLT